MANLGNINDISPKSANQGRVVGLLKKRISRLRVFVYILLAVLALFASLSVLWSFNFYYEEPAFTTYFSKPSKPPKAFLYLLPERGNYRIDDEFGVDVLINTAGNNVVATAAYLSYNVNQMEAVSVDVSGSVFNMVAEKEINNEDGKIKITIGKPSPGVNVFNGKVATIFFKAKEKINPSSEDISFDFTKNSSLYSTIILDDKKGTNILDATRGAKIFID